MALLQAKPSAHIHLPHLPLNTLLLLLFLACLLGGQQEVQRDQSNLVKMGQGLEKMPEDYLPLHLSVRHCCPLLKSLCAFTCVHLLGVPGLLNVVQQSRNVTVWVSEGPLQTHAVSHSSLLILISWEVEPVGGRSRGQLGGGDGGDTGYDL